MPERRSPERRTPERRTVAIASLVLLLILLVAVNAISNRLFSGMVLDFTEDKLFTLSDGTRQILKEIDEPITLRFYYSEKLGKTAPSFVPYVNRVRELLERYRDLAGGKIRLEIYNPEPFSDIEDKAVGAGLLLEMHDPAVPVGAEHRIGTTLGQARGGLGRAALVTGRHGRIDTHAKRKRKSQEDGNDCYVGPDFKLDQEVGRRIETAAKPRQQKLPIEIDDCPHDEGQHVSRPVEQLLADHSQDQS